MALEQKGLVFDMDAEIIKNSLKKNHKISFHGLKAKVIDITNEGLSVKMDESGLIHFISNNKISNGEINVINKNNIDAKNVLGSIKVNSAVNSFKNKVEDILNIK